MSIQSSSPDPGRTRVLIAGGGVAGLETLLALHALASDLPRHHHPRARAQVHQPVDERRPAVQAPARPRPQARGHRRRARRSLAPRGAGPRRARAHRVITRDGDEVPYDMLVLALGAHPEREWHSREVLTYHGGRDGPNYRLLLHQLREGRVNKVAFVKPAGAELAAAALRPRVADRGRLRRARPLRRRAQPDHPRRGAARDLRQDRQRRYPTAPRRMRGGAAYEQLRHTWSLRLA